MQLKTMANLALFVLLFSIASTLTPYVDAQSSTDAKTKAQEKKNYLTQKLAL